MAVFAIGDLHLSAAVDKPMDIFGLEWKDHWTRIREDWQARVGHDDIVLIPGDISWAMTFDQAKPDLDSIGELPGRKVLIKGNHDYWWSSITKLRQELGASISLIQNDSVTIDNYTICGTRGWALPGSRGFTDHDQRIYTRELQRLKLSLDHGQMSREKGRLIVMLHYPPFDERGEASGFVELVNDYKASHLVYGHLHGPSTANAFEGSYGQTQYHLVSCDKLDFKLKQIE
ncbi:MAG: metallophosphoesterase [Caldicoprobacterales bacterium]